MTLWHPKGTLVRNIIRNFWEEEHLKNGYQLVCTPHIARGELWKISGHLDYYKDNMYLFEQDKEPYVVKPMNCPFHIQIYKSKPRSYRDLPIRYAEWGTVYRYERSGTLHGLMRVRGLTQDDAHIFCVPEQVSDELLKILGLTENMLQKFGFNKYYAYLSTIDPKHPEKYMGSAEDWKMAQQTLAEALKKKGIRHRKMTGEAAFYGPKIDINIVDALGRKWQCPTIQFDFNLPKRFNITYTGTDGKEHAVIMIHRAILGAIERFFAILLEHCSGNLPTWLAPTQAIILPVSDSHIKYAEKILKKLSTHGVRAEIDNTQATVSYKIRQAELNKIRYMIICGKREAAIHKISVRKHGVGDLGMLTTRDFLKNIKAEQNKQTSLTH